MSNYVKLLSNASKEDQELIGITHFETGAPDVIRLGEAILRIDVNACDKSLLSKSGLKLIGKGIDEDTYYKYIVPSEYADKLLKEGYTKCYDEVMEPLLYKFSFEYDNRNCILYFIDHQDDSSDVLLNINAMGIIKNMPLDNIKPFIMEMNKHNIINKVNKRKQ